MQAVELSRSCTHKKHQRPYYSVPQDILKWILSFIVSPADFVRLRTVCKQWNTILEELFFGSVRMKRCDLLQSIQIIRHNFEHKIPFILTKDTLTVSATTHYLNCSLQMDHRVETTGIDRETRHYFLMSTQSLWEYLELEDQTCVLFYFCRLVGRITYPCSIEGNRAITSTLCRDGYIGNIHRTGLAHFDVWSPALVPEYNTEVETDAAMFLGIGNKFRSRMLELKVYSIRIDSGNEILLLSWTPGNEPTKRFDYFFEGVEQKDKQKIRRWEPLHSCNLDLVDRNQGRLLFKETYDGHALEDSLRTLSFSHVIKICMNIGDPFHPLIIKCIDEAKPQLSFDLQWVFYHHAQ
jgi:hypothetical protein